MSSYEDVLFSTAYQHQNTIRRVRQHLKDRLQFYKGTAEPIEKLQKKVDSPLIDIVVKELERALTCLEDK